MGKGQITAILILLGIIVIALIIVIVLIAQPSLTGNVISQGTNTQEQKDTETADLLTSTGFVLDGASGSQGLLTAPFYLSSWNIEEDGVELEIMNNINSDLLIKTVSVSSCNSITPAYKIMGKEKKIFLIPCRANPSSFRGDLIIEYYAS